MPFQYFTYRNNAITTLATNLSNVGTILIVKSATGGLFPSEYPYLLVLENIVNDVVMKREIVNVIRRDGDVFLIERGAWYCMADDTATTKTNTAFDFSTDDRVSLRFLEEELKDVNDEIQRIKWSSLVDATETQKGTPKLTTAPVSPTEPLAVSELDTRLPTQDENDAMAGTSGTPSSWNPFVTEDDPDINNNMSLTGDQTIDDIKTFSSIPLLPGVLATLDDQLVNKLYMDWIAPFLYVDTHAQTSPTTISSITQARGFRFQANKDILIKKITKHASATVTRCILKDDAWTVIQTVTFSGNIATFTDTTIFNNNDYFRIECDNNGSTYTAVRFTPTFPEADTNIDWNAWSSAWVDDATYWYNIVDITTASLT